MDINRPYLVIAKLIEQPTWGGSYICEFKGAQFSTEFKNIKIGQSYEICGSSSLSLLNSTSNPQFRAELTDSSLTQTSVNQSSIALSKLINQNPEKVLGSEYIKSKGPNFKLLIKLNQALGNSFQLHVKEGTPNTKWKPKPESWYFFEPGLVTLGIKENTDWRMYEEVVKELELQIGKIGEDIKTGSITFDEAKKQIKQLLQSYNPWKYVNIVKIPKDTLIDLSDGAIHHSWEEDESLRYGNVVYELQLDVLDKESTIRNFDKGKISPDGTTRPLQITDYFHFINRSKEDNDPQTHFRNGSLLKDTDTASTYQLLQTKHYSLEKVEFKKTGIIERNIQTFEHVFVKSGKIDIGTPGQELLTIFTGHSAFIPAACGKYGISSDDPASVVLISR